MEKLTLEHIAPYLPYGLKIQYEGITNGKEIKEYDREFKKDCEDDFFYDTREDYKPPEKLRGNKIGFIKKVCPYLHHVTYHIGTKGLQTHYSTETFKPLLRPMDLTKPIQVDGKEIVPIVELFNIAVNGSYDDENTSIKSNSITTSISTSIEKLSYYSSYQCFIYQSMGEEGETWNPPFNHATLYKWLYNHKFDVFGLIEKGLAIDVNTLETNPYE